MFESIFTLNLNFNTSDYFLPLGGGVYKTKLTRPLEFGPYYSQWTNDNLNEKKVNIGVVLIDFENYIKVSTLNDCISQPGSFFFDFEEQNLYIHFIFDKTPFYSNVKILFALYYSLLNRKLEFNGFFLEPRLKNSINISKKVDLFTTNKMNFQDQKIELENGDGELDFLNLEPAVGSEGTFSIFDIENDVEIPVYTGTIIADEITESSVILTLSDKRKTDNIQIPFNTFNNFDYPQIETKNLNKIIPEGYGKVIRITAFCLNGNSTTGNLQYRFAYDATALTKVEVIEDEIFKQKNPLNVDAANGYFELSRFDGTGSNDQILKCVCNATLRNFTETKDYIIDMNERYLNLAYVPSNYDITEFESELDNFSTRFLYMDKKQELFKWIEELQTKSSPGIFNYDITGDGRRTARVYDSQRFAFLKVKKEDLLEFNLKSKRDFTQYFSSVKINYDYDFENKIYLNDFVIDFYEREAEENYNNLSEYEINSLLNSDDEFEIYLRALVSNLDYREILPTISFKISLQQADQLDLKIHEGVKLEFDFKNRGFLKEVEGTITSLAYNYRDFTCEISIREQPDWTVPIPPI